MNHEAEVFAADTLLEEGVIIKIVAPFFLRVFGVKVFKPKVYQPFRGTLIKLSKYWLQMGITADALSDISLEQAHRLHAEKGYLIEKIIACALLDNRFMQWLFTKPLAWYLADAIKPKEALTLVQILIVLGGVETFISTTRSAMMLRMTMPVKGQKTQGS